MSNVNAQQIIEKVTDEMNDPTKLIQKIKQSEQDILKAAKDTFINQLKIYNIDQDFSNILVSSFTEKEEIISEKMGELIFKLSNEQVSKKIVIWFLQQIILFTKGQKNVLVDFSSKGDEIVKKSLEKSQILLEAIVEQKIINKDQDQAVLKMTV